MAIAAQQRQLGNVGQGAQQRPGLAPGITDQPFPRQPPDPLAFERPQLHGKHLRLVETVAIGSTPEAALNPTRFAILDTGEGDCPPSWWTVQLHALEANRTAGVPVRPLTEDQIKGGTTATGLLRSTHFQARIQWSDRSGGDLNSGRQIDVDIGGGVSLMIGPTQKLSIFILGAPDARKSEDLENQSLLIGPGNVVDAFVACSAALYPWPLGKRVARFTQSITVAIGVAAELPIPHGAVHLSIFQESAGANSTPQWVFFDGTLGAPVTSGDIEPLGSAVPTLVPGNAVAVSTGAAAAIRTLSFVWELEF